jgi:hypothetical protein
LAHLFCQQLLVFGLGVGNEADGRVVECQPAYIIFAIFLEGEDVRVVADKLFDGDEDVRVSFGGGTGGSEDDCDMIKNGSSR